MPLIRGPMERHRGRGYGQVSPSLSATLHGSRISSACAGAATAPFSGKVSDCTLPCTGSKDRACQIIQHLSAWNEALTQGLYELRERPRTRRELALATVGPRTKLDDPETLLNVARLLYMLVKKHHCVTAIELVVGRLDAHDALLCDALRGNEHIQRLRPVDFTEIRDVYVTFFSVIASLKNLRHFEYSTRGHLELEHLEVLEKTLEKTSALESLHIPDVVVGDAYIVHHLAAVTMHTRLRELSLNFSFFKQTFSWVCRSFADYIKNSDTLATLSLHGVSVFCSTNGKVILRGLRESKSIVKLEMGKGYFDDECSELMASIFAQSTVLRCFHILVSVYFIPEGGCFDSWLRSLAKNSTIEEMTLPVDIWRPQHWFQIIGALSVKENVKRITITSRNMRESKLNEFCQSGFDEEVTPGPGFRLTECGNNFSPMKSKASPDIKTFCLANETLLGNLLAVEIGALIHVTSLTLTIMVDKSHMAPLSAIVDLIGATTKLKTLDLSLCAAFGPANCGNICCAATIKSLSRNKSISKLRLVFNPDMDEAEVERLADVIRCSKSNRRLCVGFRKGCTSDIFTKHLSRGIGGNYSLVSVDLFDYFDQNVFYMQDRARPNFDRNAFSVLDTARRNFGLVSRASQILLTAEAERVTVCAAERVFRHRALLQELAGIECTPVEKAAAALRALLRAFDDIHSFMRMAGVVRSRVECHARRDGRPQLDDLNEPCWRELRRYLFLDYVVTKQVSPAC